jgi:dienelactone hydrolase
MSPSSASLGWLRPVLLACSLWAALPAAANPESYLTGLQIPEGKAGPHAAVLLLHGCSGIEANIPMWQQFLLSRGFASAAVDSFRRRGVSEICTDFTRVKLHDRMQDVYKALAEISARPDIDPKRVAVMGFSNGASAALSALTSMLNTQLAPGGPRFRAGVSVYPDCSLFPTTFAAPILVAIGAADDWTPAAACERLATRIAPGRPAFEVKVYPNAHHSFDMPGLGHHYFGSARNMHRQSGYGATVAGSPAATELAKKDVEAFLARQLAPATP